MVGPRVAAAAAQAALAALTQEDPTAQLGPASDAVPSTPPPFAAPVSAAVPAAEGPSSDTGKPAEQPEGDATMKEAATAGPTGTVMGNADGAADVEKEAGALEAKVPEGGDVGRSEKDGVAVGAGEATDGRPVEGAGQPEEEGAKAEGEEGKAEPMEVDVKEAAPAGTPASDSVPPPAGMPALPFLGGLLPPLTDVWGIGSKLGRNASRE